MKKAQKILASMPLQELRHAPLLFQEPFANAEIEQGEAYIAKGKGMKAAAGVAYVAKAANPVT